MRLKEFLNEINYNDYSTYTDQELLRDAIYEEYRAANIYSKMARHTRNRDVRRVLLDVANEEKTHVEEFKILLEQLDNEVNSSRKEAEQEFEDMGM